MATRARKTAEPNPGTPATDEPKVTETTKGKTFSEAAEAATPAEHGYIGSSAEAERTGKADKGLSQQSPGILDGSSPAPDSRKHVDDSEAIKALDESDSDEPEPEPES